MKNKTLKIKKKVINLYNFWHLGDNIFTMIYLYNCKDYIIKNNIKINIYIRKNLISQVREFICCENIKVHPIKFIETCNMPTTIAVQGEWGSGKTSMLNQIRHELCETGLNENLDKELALIFGQKQARKLGPNFVLFFFEN